MRNFDIQKMGKRIRSNWRLGYVIIGSLAVGTGLIGAFLTPRGPITTVQALGWMAVALVLGILAGFFTRSRWSLLTVPAGFFLLFELARIGVDGPTVDWIHPCQLTG
ncbi:MAG: hypothetical protein V5A81_07340 [Candidatus Bipolaricaulota bacterium]|nr:hypothetical protein [Candidatus Bipolaricaulota bacterium]MBS3793208.1 hypothetical protein [Candidatus Bipolaricaulota bacterium]